MNNIQWASGETPKLDLDEMDLVKNKGFTDLTTATGEAIKESIAAQNKLTNQIVKNIDTGQKQKEEQIKFWTELAPKAAGQVYDTIQNIKEIRAWLNGKYEYRQDLEEGDATATELNNILNTKSNQISGMFVAVNDFKNANNALEGRDQHKTKRGLLNKYWLDIRKGVYETAGELEFEINGKMYSYNGTEDPFIRREIRKRIDIAIAAQAYSTGLFSKREILNGILLKSNKENDALVNIELAANQKRENDNYTINNNKFFIDSVENGDTDALAVEITNIRETHQAKVLAWLQENPGSDEKPNTAADYPGQTVTQQVYAKVSSLIELARIGRDNNGLDPEDVIKILEDSGDIPWGDGKVYKNIIEAYNEQHNGKGNEWISTLKQIQAATWDDKKGAKTTAIEIFEDGIYKKLNQPNLSQADYTQILTEAEEELIKEHGTTYRDFISRDFQNRLTYKDVNLDKAGELFDTIVKMYESVPPRAVNPELLKQLPQYMQEQLKKTYQNRTWSIQDTKTVDNVFAQFNTPLNENVLKLAFKNDIKGMQFAIPYLRDELNIELMGYYNAHFDKVGNHNDALQLALKQLQENWKWADAAFKRNDPNHKDAKEELRKRVLGLSKPGIGLELENETQFNRRITETNYYVDNIIGNENATIASNTILFQSEEKLVGETNNVLNGLQKWVRSKGKSPIPGYYKRLSKVSGIPVERIVLYRATSLGYEFVGDNEDAQGIYKTNINDIKEIITKQSPASKALISSISVAQANLIEFDKGIGKDDTFISEQYFSGATDFAENNEGVTEFDFIQNVDKSNYKHETPISSMELGSISSWNDRGIQIDGTLFGQGKYFNIGAFGIANETEFNIIYSQLLEKGVVSPTDKFDKDTQIKFRTQALINRNAKLQRASGIVLFPTTLTEKELNSCGLGDQQYPLNEDLCKIIHSKYANK